VIEVFDLEDIIPTEHDGLYSLARKKARLEEMQDKERKLKGEGEPSPPKDKRRLKADGV
jgi:hypothetical protein